MIIPFCDRHSVIIPCCYQFTTAGRHLILSFHGNISSLYIYDWPSVIAVIKLKLSFIRLYSYYPSSPVVKLASHIIANHDKIICPDNFLRFELFLSPPPMTVVIVNKLWPEWFTVTRIQQQQQQTSTRNPNLKNYNLISRVSDQNGISLLYIMFEIHHSGHEPST